jgi:hypothetical protein
MQPTEKCNQINEEARRINFSIKFRTNLLAQENKMFLPSLSHHVD